VAAIRAEMFEGDSQTPLTFFTLKTNDMPKLLLMILANIVTIIQLYEPLKIKLSAEDLISLDKLKQCRDVLTTKPPKKP